MSQEPIAFLNGRVRLLPGDCLAVLKTIADNSIDSAVMDPPYHLTSIVKRFGSKNAAAAQFGKDGAFARASAGFMGKQWDGGDIAFRVELWTEVLRVLKPGGHLVAFSGTRTYHRMACAIEDAGFEIRDQIGWAYGSGFPKSHDVSKGIDKSLASIGLFDEIRAHVRRWRDEQGMSNSTLNAALGLATNGAGMARHWTSEVGGQHSIPSKDQWRNLKRVLGWPNCDLDAIYDSVKDGAERPILARAEATRLAVAPGQDNDRSATTLDITAPATPEAAQWQGWGTALKPAWEPICVARKPLIGTVAENVLTHGTGALNIDGCRIEADARPLRVLDAKATDSNVYSGRTGEGGLGKGLDGGSKAVGTTNLGRWPANIILSVPEDEYELRRHVTPKEKSELYRWLSENP